MYSDLPKCLRCCFCLPLRYSLAVWGYFKLIMSMIALIVLFYTLLRHFEYYDKYYGPIIVLSILITVVLIDTCFDLVLIVAAHKKHVKLFQWYYYYSLVILVLIVIATSLIIGNHIIFVFKVPDYAVYILSLTIEITVFGIGMISIQIYITLLIRTEMMKLRDNCKFEFVNNAAESECTVNVGIYPQLESSGNVSNTR